MSALAVRILAGVTLLLAVACGMQTCRLQSAQVDLAHEQQGRADDRAAAAAAAASAAAWAQADTAAIIATQQESLHVAQLARDRQDADRRAADAAHQRLLDAASRGAGGQPAGDSATVGSGLRAPAAAGVSAVDVLGWSDETSGELADYADALRISLRACRTEYDAVRLSAGRSAE